jgi:hypothetical protein
MTIRLGLSKTPKHGSSEEEYEDAFFPICSRENSKLPFSCAIGDGATETSYSGLWANLLTEAFAQNPSVEGLLRNIPETRVAWRNQTSSKPLPWYAEQKLAKGAFATLLGLTISQNDNDPDLQWEAHAVGDSCLFHVTKDGVKATFPINKAADLNLNPTLLCSVYQEGENLRELFSTTTGKLQVGERIYLVTDALAGWILRGLENDEKPFESIYQATRTEGGFLALVEGWREAKAIKNDDCTLLWVEAAD